METLTELVRVADLETSNPAFFRDLLKAVVVVNEEPDITLDPEGLRITQMSPDHVCVVDLYLSRGFFDSFNVVEEYRAALNLKDLNKLLFNKKNGKLRDSSLSIHLEDYTATFKGTGKLSGVKTFNLLEPCEEEAPTPKLVYNAKVTLVTDTLKQVIDDCTVSPNVIIIVDSDKVMFRCVNGDYLEENTFDKYDDDILELYTERTQKAIYELEHLSKFPRALMRIAEVVTLEFSTDLPMRISADLPYESHLVYYFAPKIQTGGEPEDPDPHEEPEEIPEPEEILEEPAEDINIYQALEDLGFFPYSGEDGDLFRKHGLAGWRVRVYPSHVSIQKKDLYWRGEWGTVRDFGIEGPRGTWTPETEKALEAVKELIEKGTLEEEPKAIPIPYEEPAPVEIPAVEAAPDSQEDEPSLGELYLKYYREALARHSAEAA